MTIELDTPLPGIAAGDYIFPDCELADEYIETVLNSFAVLGPGQKTNAPGLLPKALRKPLVTSSNPCALNASFLKRLSDSSPTIQDVQWFNRTVSTAATLTTVTDAPRILVPNRIAFYPIME